jgi:hypothetical protein
MMIPLFFDTFSVKTANYALVRLNAQKRVLKAKRANPDLDIFGKIPFYPFSFSGIYSRRGFGDVTDYGANVAKISKVSKCTLDTKLG